MVIGVCGFSSSGSSAVIDLLCEFQENNILDQREFTLSYFPDGIEDLEYHLVLAPSKFLSSTIALKRFRRVSHSLLSRVTHGESDKIIEDYLNKIIQVRWQGFSSSDLVLGNQKLFQVLGLSIMRDRIFPSFKRLFGYVPSMFPMRSMEYAINPDRFLSHTREMTSKLLSVLGAVDTHNTVLDQPFAGNYPEKSLKYFENPYAIIVDRDPRDTFIFTREVLGARGKMIPTDTVEAFCVYWKTMRARPVETVGECKILRIRFEDLVYEYDKTVSLIISYLGLKKHDSPQKYFVPSMSIRNTCLYKRYPQYETEVDYIEHELSEYLFPFQNYSTLSESNQKMFFGKSPLRN